MFVPYAKQSVEMVAWQREEEAGNKERESKERERDQVGRQKAKLTRSWNRNCKEMNS